MGDLGLGGLLLGRCPRLVPLALLFFELIADVGRRVVVGFRRAPRATETGDLATTPSIGRTSGLGNHATVAAGGLGRRRSRRCLALNGRRAVLVVVVGDTSCGVRFGLLAVARTGQGVPPPASRLAAQRRDVHQVVRHGASSVAG
jgi:hypothetical protein